MDSGFMIGRFQPFHYDHKRFVRKIQENFDEVNIGIYDTPLSLSNPFTFEERKSMIEHEFDIPVVKVDNVKNIATFKRKIKDYFGDSTFCTRDIDRALLMRLMGFDTFYRRGRCVSGSYIRSLIFHENSEYTKYVGPVTTDIVENHEFRERLKKIEFTHNSLLPSKIRSRISIF